MESKDEPLEEVISILELIGFQLLFEKLHGCRGSVASTLTKKLEFIQAQRNNCHNQLGIFGIYMNIAISPRGS